MGRVYLGFGEAGVGKTTFALSGEGPVDYYEFDAGSYERAAAGMNIFTKVHVHRYYAPLTNLLAQGKLSVSQRGGIAPATVHRLSGWKELFWEFVDNYLQNLDGDGRPVFDTETKMWLLIRQAFLQEVQDAAGPERERLDQLQYTEPNARHSQIIEAAKIKGKDLVMLAHQKELYIKNEATGQLVMDGYKEAPNMADCTLRFTLENKVPVATIMKAGAGGLELIGMKLTAPTMTSVEELLSSAEALRRGGFPMPSSPEEIIETAKVLA